MPSARLLAPAFAPLACLLACATVRPVTLRASAPASTPELASAVEAFYGATDTAGLRAAVSRARAAAPDSAAFHEIAAALALLEGQEGERFEHLAAALSDLSNDAPLYHLELLADLPLTDEQRARSESLLEALTLQHPSADVRARAADALGLSCRLRADTACDARTKALLGTSLPMAIIGSWDNDQGKGFDAPHPPEDGVDLKAAHEGAVVQVRWRPDAPLDARGQLVLSEAFTPSRWSVGYAAGAVRAPAEGDYELRIGTTDGLKVWVNGAQVFEARLVDAFLFDQFILPVRLRAGANTVLIKTAHGQDDWALRVRWTQVGGAPATALRPLAADVKPAPGVSPGKPTAVGTLLAQRVDALPAGSLRRAFHASEWARQMLGGSEPVAAAQALLARAPKGVIATYQLAVSLWSNGERDKTADLMGALDVAFGKDLPFLRVAQARFWRQQGLRQKAREALVGVSTAHPQVTAAWRELAELFEAEGWVEDRCNALKEVDRLRPGLSGVQLDLAQCDEQLRLRDRARARYEAVLAKLPWHPEALRRLADLASLDDDLSVARRHLETLVSAFPARSTGLLRLAELHRRLGQRAEAEAALARVLKLNPDSVEAHLALGAIAYQAGEKPRAVERWQAALERNPDDERLSNRLAYLAPIEGGAWTREVPSETDIESAVAARQSLVPMPGANVAYLLDHEVSSLRADGSTVNVSTTVLHALNQEGRDRLTVQRLGNGRTRILHAYAVDPAGRRVEASSIRGREVRFRGLQVGSTVVLQYRADIAPVGYLSKHLARSFWFQGVGDQRRLSQWILYLPAGAPLHEVKRGELTREERRVGDQLRVAYTAKDVPPVMPEPDMPTALEVNANVAVSTVPDWDTFLKWEDALLQDAFRDSPELEALAQRLFKGVDSAQEKVTRLHTFLMEDIRYQQDYENFMAGVKPHAAPVVLERGYGDCKDKAVLFIALARKAGVEAHFADVRTRPKGPILRDIPMQQFDHAIVYVPAQKGLAEGRFYDPTADALDVDSLREDDAGTTSLTLDPFTRKHAWREIPYQDPSKNQTRSALQLQLAKDGSATANLELSTVGAGGSALRRGARNPEQLRKALQHMVGNDYSGGRLKGFDLLEVKDLRAPARISLAFDAPTLARTEGDQLRFKVPIDWSLKRKFSLSERRFPLLFGAPARTEWTVDVKLPEGMVASRLPTSTTVDAGCLKLERKASSAAGAVRIEQTVTQTCDRLSPAEYPAFRAKAEKMEQLMEEEVVLAAATPAPVKKPRTPPVAADKTFRSATVAPP